MPYRQIFLLLTICTSLMCRSLPAADRIDFVPVPDFLQLPAGIKLGKCSAAALDSRGRLYLFHRGRMPLLCFEHDGTFVRGWGDDLIQTAHGLRIDRHGHIWTTDIGHHLVRKFDLAGKLLLTLGRPDQPGTGTDQFDKPSDIAFGPAEEVYISDGYGNSRVMQFDQAGKFIKTWGQPGSGPGEFDLPHTIKVDSRGRILVGDRENERIQVFDADGRLLAIWPGFAPYGIEIDREGRIFLADAAAHLIHQLDAQGKIVHSWGGLGSQPGQFNIPHMLAIDTEGNLYVTEIDGMRIQKFRRRP